MAMRSAFVHYRFHPITEEVARTVLAWEYPGLPTLYHPDPVDFEDDVAALLVPRYNYYAAYVEDGSLAGFCCYGEDAQVPGGDYHLDALDIGFGLRPDLTGRGLALGFVQAIMAWGSECFEPEYFRATVVDINTRSQRTLARAGFMITQRFHADGREPHDFIVMIRRAHVAE